ncbi:MAG: hypothetical protein M1820_000779 [Bogoriella megaspora]|nr:MAG: hypothetical protein M1820_000779 [Bogoriella megaspora]
MTTTPQALHNALLRPPILHILRAAGFHSLRPSVLDTLADITARYIALLGSTTAFHADGHSSLSSPSISDVRLALQDCGVLVPSLTAAEEAWREALRKPLELYPEEHGIRQKEASLRDAEDTEDVRLFEKWALGEGNREIRRIAGVLAEERDGELGMEGRREDYLSVLKKKHSKTGEEARFQGTVLGKPAEDRHIKIEGGPAENLQDWNEQIRGSSKTRNPERAMVRGDMMEPTNENGATVDVEMGEDDATQT